MCSVPTRWPKLRARLDVGKETVISGRVIDDSGQLVGGAFVRLLDSSDEFAAEVVASRLLPDLGCAWIVDGACVVHDHR